MASMPAPLDRPTRQEPPPPNAQDARLPPNSAMSLTEEEERICFGDPVCFLCEGQLLALTRRFNLSYRQMALIGLSTLVSGGTLALAGFFIYHKGLFRKRYAALFSDALYSDDVHPEYEYANHLGSHAYPPSRTGATLLEAAQSAGTDMSSYSSKSGDSSSFAVDPEGPETQAREKAGPSKGDAVTFRFFEYDPETKLINFNSVGKPITYGTPLIVVHASTQRAVKYVSHRGAVTISRPRINLNFKKQVNQSRKALEDTVYLQQLKINAAQQNGAVTSSFNLRQPRSLQHQRAGSVASLDLTSLGSGSNRQEAHRFRSSTLNESLPRRSTPPFGRFPQPARDQSSIRQSSQDESPGIHYISNNPPPPHTISNDYEYRYSNMSSGGSGVQRLRDLPSRTISESYESLVTELNESLRRQQARREAKKQRRAVMKQLPNMSFGGKSGSYFVATLQPVHHSCRSSGNGRSSSAKRHLVHADSKPPDQYVRWGSPMSLIAEHNNKACGVSAREHYKDSQLYLTTDTSQSTLIPLKESGDLRCMAKESTRYLAHMEKRQVRLTVGTYNVWMMPRKVSAFTGVSPKKNTRARLIADVLPPCDVWAFTECFDHRARNLLVDKLKANGYYYFTPTIGHKQLKHESMKKLLNGGVMVASKFPIVSVRIKLFKDLCVGGDAVADKGVLYCKILKDGLLVHVFATHLQAWNDGPSRSMRKAQLQAIADFKKSLCIDADDDAVIIAGDMNVDFWLHKENSEYDEMLDMLDANDPSIARTVGHEQGEKSPEKDLKAMCLHSFDPRLNPLAAGGLSSDGSLEMLDYIMYSTQHRLPVEAKSWVLPMRSVTPWNLNWPGKKKLEYNLSDHFPVVSSFLFDM